ncbi:MAG: hypothetical protein HOV83_16965, partial [Catenulispora sp.]|nr:hypothetical protein [Catenulispora sp.]
MRGRSTGGCAGSGGSADAGGSSGRGDAGSGRDNAGGSDSRGAAGGSSSSSSRLRRTLSARRPVLWLAALYLVFGALPLLALAQFCLASSDDALRHQVQTGLATTAATGAVVTGDRLGALGDLVTAAANDPALAAYLTDHEELGEGESPTEELQQLRNAQPGIAEVVMTDMQGRVLEASHADRALRDPARADWFLAVRGDPRTHLSAGYPADPAAADREVVIAAPVRDRAGRPAAVLAAAYRLAPLQAFVQQIAAAQDIDLLITDRTGTPVAASESGSGSGGERFTAARTVAGSGWTVTAEVPRARALASLNGLHSAVKGTTAALGAVLLVGLAAQVRLAWTRSLAEDRLQAARDQAVLLSERKSTLLAEASHEVRTPMNGILGMTELLQATELDPAQRRHAAAIRRSATALLTIVDDLLDLSRIEAGHIVLQPTAFDPRGLCDDVVALLAPRAEEKGLWLLARVDAGVPALLVADAGRIRQVLVNLVGNAVAYTRTGGVDVLVVADGAGERVSDGRVA